MFADVREKMGIRSKFIIMLVAMGIIALTSVGYGAYTVSMKRAITDSKTKVDMIYTFISASRNFFMEYQRPLIMELVERDRFYPELMSGFAITRKTMDMAKKEFQGYIFKQASFNPMWPENKADLDEEKMINQFREKPDLKNLEGIISKAGGESYYYKAKPIKVTSRSCLRCHGDIAKAPKDLIEAYGTENGHGWKVGEILSAFVVYVPLREANREARMAALLLFGVTAAIFLISLFPVYMFLDKRIVSPIRRLSGMTEEISVGKNLDQPLSSKEMKDEVGKLAKSVDRLRISLNKMLKRRTNG